MMRADNDDLMNEINLIDEKIEVDDDVIVELKDKAEQQE